MKDVILIPVSPGELLDKITILRIKNQRIADEATRRNVRTELLELEGAWQRTGVDDAEVRRLVERLQEVNEALWEIEDQIRHKESAACFDDSFVQLARSVYHRNDERAALKRSINVHLGSRLVEEKTYVNYRPDDGAADGRSGQGS